MAEQTKADLIEENDALRARVAELEEAQAGAPKRPTPVLPKYELSQGTVNDIRRAQDELKANPHLKAQVVVEPFTSRSIMITPDAVTWDGTDGEPVDMPGERPSTTFDTTTVAGDQA